MGQLHWSAGLLNASYPDELSPELHSAVGDLASIAGYIALQAGCYAQARQVSVFALACAEKAGDWHLRAYVLDSMATQAIRTGNPDEGLTQAELALVRPDRLTATERTLLHTYPGARAGQDAPGSGDPDCGRHRRGPLRALHPRQ